MNNFHFGYSTHAINKKITGDISLGWQSKQGTVDDLASHVKKGLPVCHSTFTGQKRADAHFNFADICLVDIDNSAILKGEDGKPVKGEDGKAIKIYCEELTIPQMMEHEFIKTHCFYSYTSASHKPDHHKYRLAFRLPNRITDPKLFKAVLLELKALIPAIDRAAISVTNIYFGNNKAIDLIVNPDALPISQEFIDRAIATQAALEAEKQALKANREAWKANYADCDNDRLEREIYRALEYIPPRIEGGGTYDTSIRVCWALASHFGESKAIAIMESHSPNHGAWDVAKVVSQFHKYPDVGIGSIFHFAKCNGYKRLEFTPEEKKAWWRSQPKEAKQEFKIKKQATAKERWLTAKSYTATHKINSSLLSLNDIPVPDDNTITAIKSDFATGKTKLLSEFTKYDYANKLGFWMLGHRNMLLEQTKARLLKNTDQRIGMLKDEKGLIAISNSGKLGCIDQLAASFGRFDFDSQVLYLDEADQSEIHRLMSSTLRNKRDAVTTNFTRLVKAARKIVLMSATLSDAVVDFIAELRANSTTKIIKYENTFVHPQNFVIYENGEKGKQGRSAVRKRILDHINMLRLLYAGKFDEASRYTIKGFKFSPFAICSDSQNECEKLEKNAKASGLKVKRIDGKNEDGDNEIWLGNLDEMVSANKIDVLIFSPSANSGVSCELNNYFSDIYCLYFGQIDIDSFLQMPLRVRDSSVIRHIGCDDYLPQNNDDDSVSSDVATISNFVKDYAQNLGEMVLDGDINEESLKLLFNDFLSRSLSDINTHRYCALKALRNYEKSAMHDCIKARLTALKHTFTSVLQGGLDKQETEIYSNEKDFVKRNYAFKVASAKVKSIEAAIASKDSGDVSFETSLENERAFIADDVGDFAQSTEFTGNFIYKVKYDKPNLIKGIKLLVHAEDIDYLKSIASAKLKKTMDSSNEIFTQDLLKNDYLRLKTLIDIGIQELIRGGATDLHGEHDAIISICKMAKKSKKLLGLNQGADESNMQFTARLLDCMGYGFRAAAQITNEKGKKENRYQVICKGGYTLLDTIAANYNISTKLKDVATFTKAIAALGDLVPTEFREMQINKKTCTQKKYTSMLFAVAARIFANLKTSIKVKIEHQKNAQKSLFLASETYTGYTLGRITTSPTYSLNK